MSDNERGPARFAGPLYFLAFLLIVVPLLDFVPNVWPFRFGEVSWRYGTVGLFANYTMTPVLGFAVLVATAAWMEEMLLLRISGWALVVWAVLLLGTSLFFTLDAVQIRSTVAPEERIVMEIGSGRAVLKNILVGAAVIWLGVAALKFRPESAVRRARSDKPTA
jgi:hypothetical protein